jgi:hypothetical protein
MPQGQIDFRLQMNFANPKPIWIAPPRRRSKKVKHLLPFWAFELFRERLLQGVAFQQQS